MGNSKFAFEKRKKDLERKKKQEEKLQRKKEKRGDTDAVQADDESGDA